jgi:hypothetical protein
VTAWARIPSKKLIQAAGALGTINLNTEEITARATEYSTL